MESRSTARGAEPVGVGGPVADLSLLLDAITKVESFITVFTTLYAIVILLYIITSWIRFSHGE